MIIDYYSVTEPLTDKDKELCDLFIRYNEKLHGKRSPDTAEFVMTSRNSAQNIVIGRDEFFSVQEGPTNIVYLSSS